MRLEAGSREKTSALPFCAREDIQSSYSHYDTTTLGDRSILGGGSICKTILLYNKVFHHPDPSLLREYLASLKIDFGCIPAVKVEISCSAQGYFVDVKFPKSDFLISKRGEIFRKNSYEVRTSRIVHLALEDSGLKEAGAQKIVDLFSQRRNYARGPILKSGKTPDEREVKFARLFRQYMNVPKLDPKRVLILSTNLGGGHATYASTLEKSLKKRDFEVLVLNIEEFSVDLFKEMGVKEKGVLIGSDKSLREDIRGNNPLLIQILKQTSTFLKEYQPSNWELLLERVYEFAPSVIFSTASHKLENSLRISSLLEVPLNIVITDHKIVTILKDQTEGFDANYFVPGDNPSELMVEKIGREGHYIVPFNPDLPPYGEKKIHLIGNAADEAYFKEVSEAERLSARASYGIEPHEKVILVTSGSCPDIDSILSVCKRLADRAIQEEIGFSYKVIVICGENPHLIDTISSLSDAFLAFPSVRQEKMAELFAISDCIVGKPGGGMAAQVEASGAFMVSERMYQWEMPNIIYLERKGLGKAVAMKARGSEKDDFTDCIKQGIASTELKRATGYARPKKLDDYMDEILAPLARAASE